MAIVLAGTIMACLLIGGIIGYAMTSLTTESQIHDLQNQVSTLKQTISDSESQDPSSETSTIENNTYLLEENVSLPNYTSRSKAPSSSFKEQT